MKTTLVTPEKEEIISELQKILASHLQDSDVKKQVIEGIITLIVEKFYDPDSQIGSVWSIEDVQSVRPDIADMAAMQVLEHVERTHDAEVGINWQVLEYAAQALFGDADQVSA